MKIKSHVAIRISSLSLLMAITPLCGAQQTTTGPVSPGAPTAPAEPPADTSPEHTSYLFGLTFGEQMHAVGITNQVDQAAIARGIKEGLEGKKSTRADQQQVQTFVRGLMAEAVAHNKQAAKEFLDKNAHEKGVKTTADGLQYKVLDPGNSKAPAVQPTDEVSVQYHGKLIDGSEFDSSYSRGVPATFKVNGVIKGWQEALVMMKPGAKWQLFVPPELGYDVNARPGIPAGSLLIFDVQLLSAKSSDAPPAAAAPPALPSAPKGPPLKPPVPASAVVNPGNP